MSSTYETTGGTEAAEDQPHEPRTIKRTYNDGVKHMMSEIGDGVFVAWESCAKCSKPVRQCGCTDGPVEPAHIQRWREGRFDREIGIRFPKGPSADDLTDTDGQSSDVRQKVDDGLSRAQEAVEQAKAESEEDNARKCTSCNYDISEYAPGLTLCAICDPEVDDD